LRYWKLTKKQYDGLDECDQKSVSLWNTFRKENATLFILAKQDSDVGVLLNEKEAEETINQWGMDKIKEIGLENGIRSENS